MVGGDTEPFPSLDGTQHKHLQPLGGTKAEESFAKVKRRRKSSGLGGEIRAGDTRGPAIATLDMRYDGGGSGRSDKDRKKPFSKRRKARSWIRRSKHCLLKHTWLSPLLMLCVFSLLYAINPSPSNLINHFVFLSYKQPIPADAAPGTLPRYGKGYWDFAFVTFYTIVLSFTREFIMQNILRPLAIRAGLRSRAKQSRFMEQMYTAIYFGVSGPVGMWVMSHTPVWYFNIAGMYEGFPHQTLEADLKFYYLFQAAYWAQQAIVLVLGMEKPRKDFKELVGHHIVSLMLIGLSYRFHFTYMGLAVYITHDISDFFLATSKTLNYIDHPLVGPYFGLFIFVWIYMRHYLNLRILVSEFNEFKTVGPYDFNWATEQYKGPLSHYISTVLLGSLQALNLFWLAAILRIAYRFLFQNQLADERSDEEDEGEEEGEGVAGAEAESERRAAPAGERVAAPELQLNGQTVGAVASGAKLGNGSAKARKS